MKAIAVLLSALVLPGFVHDSDGPAGGSLLTGVFPSATAPRPLRSGYVYLPPGFTPSRRYPVVYLLHGLRGSPSEYVDSLELARVADGLIARGDTRPFVAVIPAAGPDGRYNGEWAGPWERYLVRDVIPWVDAHLPTIRGARGRVLAGLSAGGFGAVDIGLRNPALFSALESWSGYFHPLPDGPFKHDPAFAALNDPRTLARANARDLRRRGIRFFLSAGPSHSHWFKTAETIAFARELRSLGLPETLRVLPSRRGMYATQLSEGLRWAFGPPTSGAAATAR